MAIVPGFSIHDEVIEAMVGDGNFGTIEVGKRADLILVKNNPLEDVANIEDIRGVMAAGRWYPEQELDQMIALE
jgi:imidazolonepropionase-like amidohydrolase